MLIVNSSQTSYTLTPLSKKDLRELKNTVLVFCLHLNIIKLRLVRFPLSKINTPTDILVNGQQLPRNLLNNHIFVYDIVAIIIHEDKACNYLLPN